MTKDPVLQLRYLGVIPQAGYREYGFHVLNEKEDVRQIVLTIDNLLFRKCQLMYQEAPDLCYQKLLKDLSEETAENPIGSRMEVNTADIASYRDTHPTHKKRSKPVKRRS
jgi:hypothetical protein